MRVSDLFSVSKGHGLDLTNIDQAPAGTGFAYVSCGEPNNGVTGWVRPMAGKAPAAAGTISVSLTGNSVLAAFIQESPYYTASHMAVLTPKNPEMTFAEKLWWAQCIRVNRYRFGFGRKADRTIQDLVLPDVVPAWVDDARAQEAMRSLASNLPALPVEAVVSRRSRHRRVTDLFSISQGNGLALTNLKRVDAPDGVNYIGRARGLNGVVARVMPPDGERVFEAGSLTVALGGSVLSTFVQPQPFVTAFHVAVLIPREPMGLAEKLWWTCCIEANKFRFNYGRQANRTLPDLAMPSSAPRWVAHVPQRSVEELRDAIDLAANQATVRPLRRDDRLKIDADPEDALRALLKTRPTTGKGSRKAGK